jgi:NTE family protein
VQLTPSAPRTRRGLVIGAGGIVGMAWTTGALVALEEVSGWDPRTAEVLVGTSQGAMLATFLASGIGTKELLAWYRKELPQGHPLRRRISANVAASGALPPLPLPWPASPRLALRGLLRPRQVAPMTALSGLLPGGRGSAEAFVAPVDALVASGTWVGHAATWLVAVDYDTGERVAFGSPGAPRTGIREAVRASCAVPGWTPPVVIGGRRYVDGGVFSSTSLDLAARHGLDEIIVLAPMASTTLARPRSVSQGAEWLVRRTMSQKLKAESAVAAAAGTRVVPLCPGPEDLAGMGTNFMDPRQRIQIFETSLRTSRAVLERDGGLART